MLILLTLSGVFIGGVQHISDSREDAVTEQELDRIGSEVASSLVEADTIADEAEHREELATGAVNDANAEVRVSLPSQVNDDSYTVSVEQDANNIVTVIVQSEGHIVETTVNVDRGVPTASTGSDDLIITHTDDNGDGDSELVLEDA
jgi:hypothetical protein